MKLNELVEKEGLSTISDRTSISIEILQKLVNNDFEDLTRVRSLGFLSILKREYSVELDDLESNIKEYFEEKNNNNTEAILIAVDRTNRDGGFLKWFMVLALLGGLWYLYNSGKLGGNFSSIESEKNILNDSEILKSNVSKESAEESVLIKKNENDIKVEIQTLEKISDVVDKVLQKNEVTSSIKIKSGKIIDIKENTSNDENDSKESRLDENNIDAIEESLDENNQETTDKTLNSSEDNIGEAEIIYNVTVNPRVNLWFGFINIDTKERKEFMTIDSTAMDVGEQRWVLMTGHGRVSVATGAETLNINDKIKHYFYIDSSEIREINRSEFKALNDGKGW